MSDRLAARLLRLENEVLEAMIKTRYALTDPTGELSPHVVQRVRRASEEFAATAERIQAAREAEAQE